MASGARAHTYATDEVDVYSSRCHWPPLLYIFFCVPTAGQEEETEVMVILYIHDMICAVVVVVVVAVTIVLYFLFFSYFPFLSSRRLLSRATTPSVGVNARAEVAVASHDTNMSGVNARAFTVKSFFVSLVVTLLFFLDSSPLCQKWGVSSVYERYYVTVHDDDDCPMLSTSR